MGIRLYMDEDSMDQKLVQGLRARGVDVQTALEANMIARADEDHLRYAAREKRALYSFNVVDFCRLHDHALNQGRVHAGIVLAQQQRYSAVSNCGVCLPSLQVAALTKCTTALNFFHLGNPRNGRRDVKLINGTAH